MAQVVLDIMNTLSTTRDLRSVRLLWRRAFGLSLVTVLPRKDRSFAIYNGCG